MPGELWQAYHKNGEPDNSAGLPKEDARTGVLHGAAHVWIWRRSGKEIEVMLQRRAHDMLTWPGYLDVSAAGHIDYGELPLQAAVRETREELGTDELQADSLELAFVYVMKNMIIPDTDITENELQWVYLLNGEEAHIHLAINRREVESVRWVNIKDLRDAGGTDAQDELLVPHGQQYFNQLMNSLAHLL